MSGLVRSRSSPEGFGSRCSYLHFKSVIIDNEVIYLVSINPLSILTYLEILADYMVRFEREAFNRWGSGNAIGGKTYEG